MFHWRFHIHVYVSFQSKHFLLERMNKFDRKFADLNIDMVEEVMSVCVSKLQFDCCLIDLIFEFIISQWIINKARIVFFLGHYSVWSQYIKCNSWAMSWDYATFIPLYTCFPNAHAQPSSGARCLIFGWTLRLLPYFMYANSEGSGETAQAHTSLHWSPVW